MKVPVESISTISKSLINSGFIGKVSPEDPEELALHYLDVNRLDEQIRLIEKYANIKGNFLEVGSGFGGLVTYLNLTYGDKCRAFGLEPSVDAYEGTLECTRQLVRENKIPSRFVGGFGEEIPFETETFDIVYSTSVLEHVKNPEKVLSEALRVLKPGGILQFVIPNYGSWWEGHYGVLMLPNMPKWLFKLYVRGLGRDPYFVDTLHFIRRKDLKRFLLNSRDTVEVISWGVDLFEHRLKNIDFSDWASLGKLKKWIILLHRLGLIEFGIRFCRAFHWETPFVLTIRKN
ncbi:MAG: class I SAM-dependent methyltransferase [Bacteroidales bacterium]|nr:class I SAM-dependent methyltransferase [Bacteroidales bacterium]